MASATPRRWGTGRRQRNATRTPAQMRAYITRVYGQPAAHAWHEAYLASGRSLAAAAAALVPYRYSHR